MAEPRTEPKSPNTQLSALLPLGSVATSPAVHIIDGPLQSYME